MPSDFQSAAHKVPGLIQGALLALHRDTLWLTFPVCRFRSICYCQNWLFKSGPDAVLSGPVWVSGFLDTIIHSPGASILHSFRSGHPEGNPRFMEEVCKAHAYYGEKSCFAIGPPEIKACHKVTSLKTAGDKDFHPQLLLVKRSPNPGSKRHRIRSDPWLPHRKQAFTVAGSFTVFPEDPVSICYWLWVQWPSALCQPPPDLSEWRSFSQFSLKLLE